MMDWTEEQINSLAPDPASLKAGKGLASPNKWQNIGVCETAIWGECQGSGSNPYKTQIDLREIAFKCSCPSRKFPCKHSLGILFLLIQKKELFKDQNPPAWVEEWLKSREVKKQKQEEKKETKKEVDPEKKAKTEEKRIESVNAGIYELDLWLRDLFRKGINSLQEESYVFFKNISSRMIDAKAPGLAKKIDELSSIPNSGKDWSERFLEKASSIFLLIQGFKNISLLPEENQHDIKTHIGWNYAQEEILKTTGINDQWLITSISFEEENNLKTRKTYLLGLETNKYSMLLDYSYGAKPFENINILPGKVINGEICFYPSAYPLRGLIKNSELKENEEKIADSTGFSLIEQMFNEYAKSLSLNPFNETIPVLLKNVTPVYKDECFIIKDHENNYIDIHKRFTNSWVLLSISGGNNLDIFGEWNGKHFYPLSIFTKGKIFPLSGIEL